MLRIRIGRRGGGIILDPGSSGSEMNLKLNFTEKLIKFPISQQKCSIQIYQFLFVQKMPLKNLKSVIMCNLKHLLDGNEKEKFMLRLLEKKSCRIRNQLKSRIRIWIRKKNHSRSPTLYKGNHTCSSEWVWCDAPHWQRRPAENCSLKKQEKGLSKRQIQPSIRGQKPGLKVVGNQN